MIWTAISYNWSAALTSANVFVAGYDKGEAADKFKETFIGENLLALIPGDHTNKTFIY